MDFRRFVSNGTNFDGPQYLDLDSKVQSSVTSYISLMDLV